MRAKPPKGNGQPELAASTPIAEGTSNTEASAAQSHYVDPQSLKVHPVADFVALSCRGFSTLIIAFPL